MSGISRRDNANLRYAFDLGTNSLGWAVYRLDTANRPEELVDCGVRIFSDGRNPKDGQSLAAMRRTPRSARRRRDRFLQRKGWLMTLLVQHGLMPDDESERKVLEKLDPYHLRAQALDHPIPPHHIGRALFHIDQRRGFKSNRITDGGDDEKEKGKIAAGAAKLAALLEAGGWRTLGEYQASLAQGPVRERAAIRTRMRGQGVNAAYEAYPQREMLEAEFRAIWTAQAEHHPAQLTPDAFGAIHQAIFHQRPLKPPVIGCCTFNPTETRIAQALPLAQALRIYQELAHLKVEEGLARARPLTLEERDILAEPLLAGEDLTFGKVRKLIGIGGAARVNLEEGGRDRIKGDETAARLGGKRGRLKRLWPDLGPDQRAGVIERLLDEADEASLVAWLTTTFGATDEEAVAAAQFRPPEGYSRLGPSAAKAVLEQLKLGDPSSGLTIPYSEACLRAGFHHSDFRDGEVFDRLPDYREVLERHTVGGTGAPEDPPEKRLGRITNPTVHIGLNQLRRVVNALIARHGPPEQIVVELARELKQTKDDKEKAQKENRRNEEANRRRAEDLTAAGHAVNGDNLRRLRLWEDLGPMPRTCTYTGRTISFSELLSDEIEIEHILPFSRTLDDSMANKTVTWRAANRGKRNQAPEEAYSGAEYEAIQQRALALPPNKRWRFLPGAMERFENDERGFLDRQLNETRYLSRLAREYLGKVAGPDNVWVVTGQLTAMLRARWGLNPSNLKNRDNHRHHAIDAAAIGVIDRTLLQEMARRAGAREGDDRLEEITRDVPEPYAGFRQNVLERAAALIVSFKAEHGTGGALHEETAYGLVSGKDKEEGNLVYRKGIDALSPKDIDRVRDRDLRARLQALRDENGVDTKKLAEALRAFGEANRVRRVRILKKEESAISIADRRSGLPYKALVPGENHHVDIVEDEKGVWRGFAVTLFEANQKRFEPAWKSLPGVRLVMRLHKNDMVEIDDKDGARRVKRVVRINPSESRIYLAAHDEAGQLAKRDGDPDDPFKWDYATISKLKERKCTQSPRNELGQINS